LLRQCIGPAIIPVIPAFSGHSSFPVVPVLCLFQLSGRSSFSPVVAVIENNINFKKGKTTKKSTARCLLLKKSPI
jgi:hypothetical protein